MRGVDASPVFVGRSVEIALFGDAVRRAAQGEPTVVLVGGEAGVGKTRLVDEAVGRLDPGIRTLVGHAIPGVGRGLPYAPFAELFRSLSRRLPPSRLAVVLGPARSELGLVVPELEVGLPAGEDQIRADDVAETRAVSRARLFELILGVAHRLQADGPIVIVVEDLQWADEGTLDLLGFLVRSIERARILLVVTMRTDDLPADGRVARTIGEIERSGTALRLEVGRLSSEETTVQVRAILGATADAGVVGRIVERSDGNPFLAEELAAAERRREGDELPMILDDLLRARFATVSEPTRAILRLAALLGMGIDDGLIASASGSSAADVARALREATARGLLVRAGRAPVRYAFRHALLREAIEADLLPGEARTLHAACAEALAASVRPELVAAEVARHWRLAGDPLRALPAAVGAGLESERRFAFADARRQFETAASLWAEVGEVAIVPELDRVGILAHAADAAALAGTPGDAVALVHEALDLVDPDGDPRRAAGLHERLRWYLWEAGDREGAERALEEALALVPAEPPSSIRARVLAQLAGLRLRQGRLAESLDAAGQAIEVARSSGALPELAFALGVRSWDQAESGRPDEALADVDEAVGIAELLGRPEGRALGAVNLAELRLYVGRLDEALAAARDGLDVVRAIGLERVHGGSLAATAAAACFRLGRWTEAVELIQVALATPPPGPDALWPAAVAIRIGAGRGDDALCGAGTMLAEPALPLATDRLHRSWFAAGAAEETISAGDHARASASATRALADLGPAILDEATASLVVAALRALADRVDAAHAAGDDRTVGEARAAAASRLDDWRRRRMRGSTGVPDRPAIVALDALARAEGRRAAGTADVRDWDRATAAQERAGLFDRAAYAHYRAAEGLLHSAARRHPGARLRAGSAAQRAQAGDRLRIAFEMAGRLGARPLGKAITLLARRARLEEILVAAGAPPGPSPAKAAAIGRAAEGSVAEFVRRRGLTPREVEVLALVSAGWSNGEIAASLFIGRKTASVHVSNILGKLGASDRVEAAAMAQRVGLGGPPRPGSALEDLEAEIRLERPDRAAPVPYTPSDGPAPVRSGRIPLEPRPPRRVGRPPDV